MSDKDVFAALEKAVLPLLSVFLLSVAPPCAVSASEPAAGDGWKYGVAVYLWGAGMGGRTTTGSDIDVSFGDLLDNLKMAFMGIFGARNGRWGDMADAIAALLTA